jgi:hypothetical protein
MVGWVGRQERVGWVYAREEEEEGKRHMRVAVFLIPTENEDTKWWH